MDTMTLPKQPAPRRARRWRWVTDEILAHPLRASTIMTLSVVTFLCAFALGRPMTLEIPADTGATTAPDVRLMPHPSSPVARPTSRPPVAPVVREATATPTETSTPSKTAKPAPSRTTPPASPARTPPTTDPPVTEPARG